jgi:single-strand DNA-binding protein
MNSVTIIGFLGADPEVRTTASGEKVTNFRVADSRTRNGEETVFWWDLSAWGFRFDKIISYLKKGSSVLIIGELTKLSPYTSKTGETKCSLKAVVHRISFPPSTKKDSDSKEIDSLDREDTVNSLKEDDEVPF